MALLPLQKRGSQRSLSAQGFLWNPFQSMQRILYSAHNLLPCRCLSCRRPAKVLEKHVFFTHCSASAGWAQIQNHCVKALAKTSQAQEKRLLKKCLSKGRMLPGSVSIRFSGGRCHLPQRHGAHLPWPAPGIKQSGGRCSMFLVGETSLKYFSYCIKPSFKGFCLLSNKF